MLNGQVLDVEAAEHAQTLGEDISKDLSLNTHINRITARANRTLSFLEWNIKTKHADSHIHRHSSLTLVRPPAGYDSPVWNIYTLSYINNKFGNMRPVKIQISLRIRSLIRISTLNSQGCKVLHMDKEDSDR